MGRDERSPTSPLDSVVNATFGVLHIAADVSGVPYAGQAVDLVKKIAQLALNVPRNKYVNMIIQSKSTLLTIRVRHQALQLSRECNGLCSIITRATEGVADLQTSFTGQLLSEFTM